MTMFESIMLAIDTEPNKLYIDNGIVYKVMGAIVEVTIQSEFEINVRVANMNIYLDYEPVIIREIYKLLLQDNEYLKQNNQPIHKIGGF